MADGSLPLSVLDAGVQPEFVDVVEDVPDERDRDGWFAQLKLPADAPYDAVKKACRALLRTLHADKRAAGAEAAAACPDESAFEAAKAMRDVLTTPALRATYHSRGAEAALAGIREPDGTEALHVDKMIDVSLAQLCSGGERVLTFEQRTTRQGHRRREVTVRWAAGTPNAHVVLLRNQGHQRRLRDPVFTDEVRLHQGDLRVTLNCTGTPDMVAFGRHLLWTVGRSAVQNVARVPLSFTHPDGKRAALLMPPPDRAFPRVAYVPHAGIGPQGALWIVCTHAPAAAEDVVPDEAGRLLCDANGWSACPPPPTAEAARAADAAWLEALELGTPCTETLRVRPSSLPGLRAAQTAEHQEISAANARVRKTLGMNTIVPDEDAAATQEIALRTGAGQELAAADTVTECRQQ